MSDTEKTWFYKAADGGEQGPFGEAELHQKVVEGDIMPETPVSDDGKNWKSAVSLPECGFDCLVLQTEPALDVLGPFTREYLDKQEVIESIPKKGLFFVRSGTVADAAFVPEFSRGGTGAALVSRLLAAESALRDSRKRCRDAEAALKAKDLEFESERAKFKADAVKLASELDGLRADLAARTAREREDMDLQARLVDAENRASKAESRLAAAKSELAAAKEKLSATEEKLSATEDTLAVEQTKAAEAEKALAAAAADAENAKWLYNEITRTASEAQSRFSRKAEFANGNRNEPAKNGETVEADVVPAASMRQSAQSVKSGRMAALEAELKRELGMIGESGSMPEVARLFKKGK